MKTRTENKTDRAGREGWAGWDTYASFYDWENAQTVRRRDVAFWQRLAGAAEGDVLELGCGTGRVSLPVARSGTRLVGIDRSEPMLARARRRIARGRLADRLSLVRGDIRVLPFRARRFGLVMAPYGILQSLVRERDLGAALSRWRACSRRADASASISCPTFRSGRSTRARKTLSGRMGPATTVSLVESVRQDRKKHLTIFDQRYTTVTNRQRREHHFSLTFRTLSVPQMARRLEKAGFVVDAVLGDYRGGPWDDRADVWVLIARKR